MMNHEIYEVDLRQKNQNVLKGTRKWKHDRAEGKYICIHKSRARGTVINLVSLYSNAGFS
jgi:hypothetical protein